MPVPYKSRMFRFDRQEADSPRLSVVYLESRFFHTTIKIAKYVLCCRPGSPAIVQFLDATDPCFSLWCCVDCMESVIASHQGISILFYYFILIPSRNIIIRCSVSCVLNCTRVAPSCVTCLTLAAAGLSAYVVWFLLNNTCRTCTCMIGWCKARLLWHCAVSSCRHGLPSVSRRTRQTPPSILAYHTCTNQGAKCPRATTCTVTLLYTLSRS